MSLINNDSICWDCKPSGIVIHETFRCSWNFEVIYSNLIYFQLCTKNKSSFDLVPIGPSTLIAFQTGELIFVAGSGRKSQVNSTDDKWFRFLFEASRNWMQIEFGDCLWENEFLCCERENVSGRFFAVAETTFLGSKTLWFLQNETKTTLLPRITVYRYSKKVFVGSKGVRLLVIAFCSCTSCVYCWQQFFNHKFIKLLFYRFLKYFSFFAIKFVKLQLLNFPAHQFHQHNMESSEDWAAT